MIPCILTLPRKFREFIGFIFDKARKLDPRLKRTVCQYILALLLTSGRKDCSKLERLYDRGEGSSFRRLLSHSGMFLIGLFDEALEKVFSGLTLKPGDMLLLAIDITYLSHKGKISIENLHEFRPNGKKKIRAHSLAVAALIIDRVAVPVGCKPFVTQKYAEKHGLTFKTQTQLCIELVREFVAPPGMKVVVLADSGLDCDQLYAQCYRKEFGFVVCLKRNRKILDPSEKFKEAHPEFETHGVSLSEYSSWLVKAKVFKRIELLPVEGKRRPKAFYVYRETCDVRNVADQIDDLVNLLFSGRKANNGDQIRVFATNLQSLSATQISELYSCRWMIECLFKFLKQELGLGDCQSDSWLAHKQHVRLVLIAYLFLLHQRLKQHGRLRLQSEEKPEYRGLYGELLQFREQAAREQFEPLLKAAESKRSRPSLVQKIRRILQRTEKNRKAS